jgi:large subunit ribosomal protein L10
MNREQKAAVVDEVAAQIKDSDAVFAVDYRGLSVTQAVELRARLDEVDAGFRVVKNRLTLRAADKAGADSLKALLEGPTAFAFVKGDAALAAKAIATFRRERGLLAFKGGTMEGQPLTVDQLESIARLPGRDQLQGQFVGVLASPITGLVRGLGSMIQGLALQLGQIHEQGLVGGTDSATVASDGDGSGQMADGDIDATEAGEAEDAGPAPADGGGDVAHAEDEGRATDAEEDAPAAAGEEETSAEAGGETAAEASEDQSEASDEAEAKED